MMMASYILGNSTQFGASTIQKLSNSVPELVLILASLGIPLELLNSRIEQIPILNATHTYAHTHINLQAHIQKSHDINK